MEYEAPRKEKTTWGGTANAADIVQKQALAGNGVEMLDINWYDLDGEPKFIECNMIIVNAIQKWKCRLWRKTRY